MFVYLSYEACEFKSIFEKVMIITPTPFLFTFLASAIAQNDLSQMKQNTNETKLCLIYYSLLATSRDRLCPSVEIVSTSPDYDNVK